MSESKANLEQILELLLAEENEKAEELLHEYVVGKARSEYEKVLDEADSEQETEEDTVEETTETEEEAVEEEISQDHDFIDDITADANDIDAEEEGR